jgi:hypothetical protein
MVILVADRRDKVHQAEAEGLGRLGAAGSQKILAGAGHGSEGGSPSDRKQRRGTHTRSKAMRRRVLGEEDCIKALSRRIES